MNNLHYAKNLNQLNSEELAGLRDVNIKVLANHSRFDEHKDYGIEIHEPFYYTILRDPVKRFISHYNFFYYNEGMDGCKDVTLNDLGKEKLLNLVNQLANMQIQFLSHIKHINLFGLQNVFKIAAYNLVNEFGCFGILEQMDKSLEVLNNKSPEWILFGTDFPSLNTHKPKIEVNPEIVKIIENANQWDIKLYHMALDQFKQVSF